MLSVELRTQLSTYLGHLKSSVELVAWGDPSDPRYVQVVDLLKEVAQLSDQVSVKEFGEESRSSHHRHPSFEITSPGRPHGVVEFAGLPLGHEFTSLVLALLHVSGHAPKISPQQQELIAALDEELEFETYFSQSCQNCPDVVQALNILAALNPKIKHVSIDGSWFEEEVEARQVMAVPSVFLNGQPFSQGRMSLDDILEKISSSAQAVKRQAWENKPVFDVLVVGGGPAGSSAAIYAARKGIVVGLVAQRLGGQVQDTMSIENLISVVHTEGPELSSRLEHHVRQYDVDIMTGARAISLSVVDGHHAVELEGGIKLLAKSLVLAPGAQWRQMGVPGEREYRNKGVTYCPHCDGPLFKGKAVAVIGGGNSGVEAAIDLAGVVRHVTLLEFDGKLRADDVLQRKLRSLDNVRVITNAHTRRIEGDGRKVTGLVYEDRQTHLNHDLSLDGVFVQIGLLPSTEWLGGAIPLSAHGEIVIDDRGATSVPGVFAAGDATTEPYKQIVVAMGGGATAALSAFDWLMRQ